MTRSKTQGEIESDGWGRIERIAFALALAAAAARCTLLETLREPFAAAPGTAAYPRGTGAAASIALDLICCIPALLVLLRRVINGQRAMSLRWTAISTLTLTLWMLASAKWADDQFATVVSSAHFLAAMSLLWAMSRLARSWLHLRLVAATAFGLLLVMLAHGFYYKFVELPELIDSFEHNKTQILQDRGFAPGSFAARQFEGKIVNGEMIGFNASANSYAAMIVLLWVVGAGAIIQRIADGDPAGWAIALGAATPGVIWLLVETRCKAAMATPVLAVILLAAIWKWRSALAHQASRIFWTGLGAVLIGVGAVVGHGLYHHGLPTESLNFRWRYWVASWRMFLRHPWVGVGWDNFNLHYLRDRLAAASEEIRDPHNFLVRFAVELGAIGLALAAAWLLSLWWEMTRPTAPNQAAPYSGRPFQNRPLRILSLIVAATIAINIVAGLDFSQTGSFIVIELMKRALYFCAMMVGVILVGLRGLERPRLDDRDAPWILYGLLVSIGVFLIHNLIEFSLFEPGPLCLFAVLAGTSLGIRDRSTPVTCNRIISAMNLAGVAGLWIAAGACVWIPIVRAESEAEAGDRAVQEYHFAQAADDFALASAIVPFNADYAYRAGRALHLEATTLLSLGNTLAAIPQDLRRRILDEYGMAIDRNPLFLQARLGRASLAVQTADTAQALADFDFVLSMNPNDVTTRLEYADDLRLLHLLDKAAEQLRLALFYDDQLDPGEPKRLSAQKVEQIKKQLAALGAGPGG